MTVRTTLVAASRLLLWLPCFMAVVSAHAQAPPGDTQRGKAAIERRSCVACHVVPGIPGPATTLGPSLEGSSKRGYIAGVLANTPANMERWLREPQLVVPGTVMPNMGIGPAEARDIVAYLRTLR